MKFKQAGKKALVYRLIELPKTCKNGSPSCINEVKHRSPSSEKGFDTLEKGSDAFNHKKSEGFDTIVLAIVFFNPSATP